MKITILTKNQLRHNALIQTLSAFAEVYAVQECSTLFPERSDLMKEYFSHVTKAEKEVFGSLSFTPAHTLAIGDGDINKIDLKLPESDYYIVFGSSYIKGKLLDFLIKRKAINLHMGFSPYYRGSACNFWASFDGKPEYVGATIHYLSEGLDSGNILYTVVPEPTKDPFLLGMKAVKIAHDSLVSNLQTGFPTSFSQDKSLEIRYSKRSDFTEDVVEAYLHVIKNK